MSTPTHREYAINFVFKSYTLYNFLKWCYLDDVDTRHRSQTLQIFNLKLMARNYICFRCPLQQSTRSYNIWKCAHLEMTLYLYQVSIYILNRHSCSGHRITPMTHWQFSDIQNVLNESMSIVYKYETKDKICEHFTIYKVSFFYPWSFRQSNTKMSTPSHMFDSESETTQSTCIQRLIIDVEPDQQLPTDVHSI